ncbi:MAG: hypothetical protein DIU73_006475 [Actinomycetes bacterium]
MGLGLALLVPLLIANPVRFQKETAWSRRASVAQALLLFVANQVAIGVLIVSLVSPDAGS